MSIVDSYAFEDGDNEKIQIIKQQSKFHSVNGLLDWRCCGKHIIGLCLGAIDKSFFILIKLLSLNQIIIYY